MHSSSPSQQIDLLPTEWLRSCVDRERIAPASQRSCVRIPLKPPTQISMVCCSERHKIINDIALFSFICSDVWQVLRFFSRCPGIYVMGPDSRMKSNQCGNYPAHVEIAYRYFGQEVRLKLPCMVSSNFVPNSRFREYQFPGAHRPTVFLNSRMRKQVPNLMAG